MLASQHLELQYFKCFLLYISSFAFVGGVLCSLASVAYFGFCVSVVAAESLVESATRSAGVGSVEVIEGLRWARKSGKAAGKS